MTLRRPRAVSLFAALLFFAAVFAIRRENVRAQTPAQQTVFGYADFAPESRIEEKFLAVPDAQLAGQELKTLTAEPHLAATPEDHQTVYYIAQKFRDAGLETQIVPYRVLLSRPQSIHVEAFDAAGHMLMNGPSPERLVPERLTGGNTTAQSSNTGANISDPRIVPPYNASSGSGDVTGQVVYANYGRLEDFDRLAAEHIDLHGKIVLVRYGSNFRGVKAYIAELRGAIGELIYSDPQDDGYFKGDAWPIGPWRPEYGVQRGAVQYLFRYPGDPETPGAPSTMDLPESARVSPDKDQPHIPVVPLSYHDAEPILQALKGASVPDGWQGALPFRYHLGPGGVTVHMAVQMDYERRTIWDVIGTVKGTQYPDAWVLMGNHHDAWVYGAVDPGSGTVAMLEAVHGIGELLRQGWRPKRTMVFCSWDAEEEGLIGSTEWAEQHARDLARAVAYFNIDVGVSGPAFTASGVPSLARFLKEITRSVSSPLGNTVYQQWKITTPPQKNHHENTPAPDVHIDNLGSGSDYTPFLQHLGVPSMDIGSSGSYGVYHSVFDSYAWYTQNADPHFLYAQEMARVLGLETLRMADADVLPLDYVDYAREISSYLDAARRKAADQSFDSLNFTAAQTAAGRFAAAAQKVYDIQIAPSGDLGPLNLALRQAESSLLLDAGLPTRPWYRHAIYAPGEFTGYAAVVLPGVNEAIDAHDQPLAARQLAALAQSLDRAAATLESVR